MRRMARAPSPSRAAGRCEVRTGTRRSARSARASAPLRAVRVCRPVLWTASAMASRTSKSSSTTSTDWCRSGRAPRAISPELFEGTANKSTLAHVNRSPSAMARATAWMQLCSEVPARGCSSPGRHRNRAPGDAILGVDPPAAATCSVTEGSTRDACPPKPDRCSRACGSRLPRRRPWCGSRGDRGLRWACPQAVHKPVEGDDRHEGSTPGLQRVTAVPAIRTGSRASPQSCTH